MISLGDKVTDPYTEFSGVVTQINLRLGGSTTVLVQPVMVDYGVLLPAMWFEAEALKPTKGEDFRFKPLGSLA